MAPATCIYSLQEARHVHLLLAGGGNEDGFPVRIPTVGAGARFLSRVAQVREPGCWGHATGLRARCLAYLHFGVKGGRI